MTMGSISMSARSLISSVSEIVGYKSGLALSLRELNGFARERYDDIWPATTRGGVRVRSEELEGLIAWLLYRVGNTPTASTAPPITRLFHQLRGTSLETVFLTISERWTRWLSDEMSRVEREPGYQQRVHSRGLDPTSFVEGVLNEFGTDGAQIAIALFRGLDLQMHQSPWTSMRRMNWREPLKLRELFESEGLDAEYGSYIDQRFVDFLAANLGELDRMNWRKFEGLVAEYLDHVGYDVQIGPGRKDGGIDVRAWSPDAKRVGPAALIVQCKRQRKPVEALVVKALWHDLKAENAERALIVTSNTLAPDAHEVCAARSFEVMPAERATVKKWLTAMRTPWSGIILPDDGEDDDEGSEDDDEQAEDET